MTDAELERHNELARAQRDAALGEYSYLWRHNITNAYLNEARARIAAKYPLKRRVKRENEWIKGSVYEHRVHAGYVWARESDHPYGEPVATVLTLETIRALAAQFDAADTVEEIHTWEEG